MSVKFRLTWVSICRERNALWFRQAEEKEDTNWILLRIFSRKKMLKDYELY